LLAGRVGLVRPIGRDHRFLSLTYLAITILYLDGESALLVLVMAIIPFAWFWGYFKLAKPLKIVIGSRSAPG